MNALRTTPTSGALRLRPGLDRIARTSTSRRWMRRSRTRDEAEAAAAALTSARKAAAKDRPAAGRRLPDLSALPPLLHTSGTFADLRTRLGPPGAAPAASGRHAGLVGVPHGAKSYLAAALALGASGERLVWVARDAEIGDRVAEELGAWLGDPGAVATLEPRTSLAYERSELVPDETSARVAALAAWRSGRARVLVASVQALLQHTIDPADLPETPWLLKPGARIGLERLLAELFALGYSPVFEVAGRGDFARRGGIVDCFPPTSEFPVRIEFFGDEIESIRSFDPADQRTIGPLDAVALLPASEFLMPAGGTDELRARLKGRGALTERLKADLERIVTAPITVPGAPEAAGSAAAARRARPCRRPGRSTSATRPRSGPASWRPPRAWIISVPGRCSSSTSPATSRKLPTSCGARRTSAATSWSGPATCRRRGPRPTSSRVPGRVVSSVREHWS